MAPAFVAVSPVLTSPRVSRPTFTTATRMSAQSVVEKYYPVYRRHKAPVIEFRGDTGIALNMVFISAFAEVDKDAPPLLDYSDPDAFVANKAVPPSAISWPSGDGRGNTDFKGVGSAFTQPNLKTYGPFPDYFKVSSCISSYMFSRIADLRSCKTHSPLIIFFSDPLTKFALPFNSPLNS